MRLAMGPPAAVGCVALLSWSCRSDAPKREVAPVVAFQAPIDGSVAVEVESIDFVGSVDDANGLRDVVRWTFTSDRDGLLGLGIEVPEDGLVRLSRTLSLGVHLVTLRADDEAGNVASDAVTVTIEGADQRPQATLLVPQQGDVFVLGTVVDLLGAVSDPNESPEELSTDWWVAPVGESFVEVPSDGADSAGATEASWSADAVGQYRARLVVVDGDGNASEAQVLFQVTDGFGFDNDRDGWSVNEGDCNDRNDAVFPGAEEFCGNGIDDDCNGELDDRDADADGYIDWRCNAFDGLADDCDDADPGTHPDALEWLDGADNDCDALVDEDTDAWDLDGDCVCVALVCTGSDNLLCAVLSGGDCADDDPYNFPGNAEVCDGRDNDCDASADEGLASSEWWPDADGDGFGASLALPVRTCSGPPLRHVGEHTDCNDGDPDVNPLAIELLCDDVDNDCAPATLDSPDEDNDGVPYCSDCDDDDPNNFPGNSESCDGVDNDCDEIIEEGIVFLTYHPDADGDAFGDPAGAAVVACARPDGMASNDLDCDDGNSAVHPEQRESTCDGVDNDCNPATLDAWDLDIDGVSMCMDCDDDDPYNFPGNPETCDGQDNDCNFIADDGVLFIDYYPDTDVDGHGDPNALAVITCDGPPLGHVSLADDCDDGDSANFPGNAEACDGADNDCDTVADNGLVFTSWWPDIDDDGFGSAGANPYTTCDGPPMDVPRVSNGADCNDGDASVNPGMAELTCDGLDNDCEPATEDAPDLDSDGASMCLDCDDGDAANFPGNLESCDGVDNDCNTLADDGLPFADAWPDVDLDSYGDGATSPVSTCDGPPSGHVSNDLDCDDADANNFPGNPEVCDGLDNDCDGTPDNGCT